MTGRRSHRKRFLPRAVAAILAAVVLVLVSITPAHAAVSVTFVFQDANDDPLPNFSVVVDSAGYTTSVDGTLQLSLKPGTHQVRANESTYPNDYQSITVTSDSPQQIVVTFERYASVTGSIPAGTFATVSYATKSGGSWDYASSFWIIQDTGDGTFEIPLEGGTGEYSLFFDVNDLGGYFDTWYGPSLEPQDTFTITTAGEVHNLGAVELFAPAEITGFIYEEDGTTPIPGALVTAWSDETALESDAVTGGDGSYSVTVHPGYQWVVTADAEGFGTMHSAAGGGTPIVDDIEDLTVPNGGVLSGVNLHLPALGTIHGVVFESDGTTPVPDAEIYAWSSEGDVDTSTTSASDGTFTLHVHPGLAWTLEAYAYGFKWEYYDGVDTELEATVINFDGGDTVSGVTFTLERAPSAIVGLIFDAPDLDIDDPGELVPLTGATAHLYKLDGSTWIEVDSHPIAVTPDPVPLQFFGFPSSELNLDDPESLDDLDEILVGLDPGDYRVFFSQGDQWIPVLAWAAFGDRLPLDADEDEFQGEGFFCYLDASGLALGTFEFFVAAVSSAQATDDCDPEVVHGTVTPTPTPKPSPPKQQTTVGPGSGQGDGTGALDGEPVDEADESETEPEVDQTPAPSPAPTATPTPTPETTASSGGDAPDLAWLWWAGGILLLVIIAGGTVLVLRRP